MDQNMFRIPIARHVSFTDAMRCVQVHFDAEFNASSESRRPVQGTLLAVLRRAETTLGHGQRPGTKRHEDKSAHVESHTQRGLWKSDDIMSEQVTLLMTGEIDDAR